MNAEHPESQQESSLEGRRLPCGDAASRHDAIEKAFDYRGDVTVHTRDGGVIDGFLFDRRGEGPEAEVRIMPAEGGSRVSIAAESITEIHFSGRDTAAGKSWENWLKRYATKKLKGESARIDPDPHD